MEWSRRLANLTTTSERTLFQIGNDYDRCGSRTSVQQDFADLQFGGAIYDLEFKIAHADLSGSFPAIHSPDPNYACVWHTPDDVCYLGADLRKSSHSL